ncbi:MAG TPA: NAD(+)/NADH kinase [Clostridia bacterium]|nr:NAD(+)/NADH kinase [Clostridia bacterium]
MPSIGIIANPASGKDIRRLVSYATTIDNLEKVNVVKRIVLAAQALGVDEILFMPDSFQIGHTVIDDLSHEGKLTANCRVLDLPLSASSSDTTAAATLMERLGVHCAVVLGGDGTSRAAAKGVSTLPLLPVSTGTNNVYPSMLEGTVAGMSAAAVALKANPLDCCIRDKRVEVAVNGEYADMALIDAVVTDDIFIGSRAIWEIDKIRHIVVTRCHPASIGFSSIAGCREIVRDSDAWGLFLALDNTGEATLAPVAAGVLSKIYISQSGRLPVDTPHVLSMTQDGMVALDGERELKVRRNDTLSFTITQNGPWRIQTGPALEQAARQGLFCPQRFNI